MILPLRFRPWFKALSLGVAAIFLSEQLAWAGDFIETFLEKDKEAQAQTYAPTYLQEQQALQESIVYSHQDAEDFTAVAPDAAAGASATGNQDASSDITDGLSLKGPRVAGSAAKAAQAPGSALTGGALPEAPDGSADSQIISVTTSSGDIIKYKGGVIDSIEKADGVKIRNIVVDEDNNLINAQITYADGTVQVVEAGKVKKVTRPDGTAYNYNSDELVESVTYPDNTVALYSYTRDESGSITETAVTDPEKTSYYDNEDKLKKVLFNSGKLIEYKKGVLSKVVDTDGASYYYAEKTAEDGTITVSLSRIESGGIKYTVEDNRIVEMELADGTVVKVKDGMPDLTDEIPYVDYDEYHGYEWKYFVNLRLISGIKTTFRLDGSKVNSYVQTNAYSTLNNKYTSFNFWFSDIESYVSYSVTDRKTNKTTSDIVSIKDMGLAVEKDTDYTAEYFFRNGRTDFYIYKSSDPRPSAPKYSFTDSSWTPIITMGGCNADFKMLSPDVPAYSEVKKIIPSLSAPVPEDRIYLSRFKFSSGNVYKNVYQNLYGKTNGVSYYNYLSYSSQMPYIWKYMCDYDRKINTCDTIPLGITIDDDAFYYIKTEIKLKSLKIYIYKEGDLPGQPVYAEDDLAWDPIFAGGINGGELDLSAYNTIYRSDLADALSGITIPAISAPYADVITYNSDRTIRGIVEPGGGVISYSDGLVDRVLSADGQNATKYSYDISPLNSIKNITIARDGIKRVYDSYGNLQSLSLDDATRIVYENGKVKEILKSDGTAIRNITFRDSGEIDSALISYPDGSVGVYEDARLLQLISQSGDITDYSDGKIRKVTLEDGTTYDWSYEGNDIIILDLAKQERRTYFEGALIKLEELSGAKLTTRYFYDSTTKGLIRSEICRIDELLYTYTYTYDENLTLVHDEDGNTQAYTREKKLSYIIDSQGRKYSYTYVGKNEGYIEVYFPSGIKVRYDSMGNIIDVTESDGAVAKEIILTPDGQPKDFIYIKNGDTYIVKDGVVAEVVSKDGTDTKYCNNGYTESIKAVSGELAEYLYYVKDNKMFSDAVALLSGDFNNTSIYTSNNISYLTLSQVSLQFGTGVDGIKHVTENETLASGEYNFTSLFIDAGKTLTVASGTSIKCLDTLYVKGTLSGSDLSIGASTITVDSGGCIKGLSQNIIAGTINNAGLISDVCMETPAFNLSGYSGAATPVNSCDGNFSTSSGYFYRERGGSGYFYNGNYTYWTWTFPTAQDISKLSWKIYCMAQTSAGASENSGAWGVYITVTDSSGTSVLVNESGGGCGNWSGGYSQNNNLVENSTGWKGVTKIEVRLYGKAKRVDAGAGGGNEDIYHYLYEMKADGANISYKNSTGNVPISKAQYTYPSSGTFESDVIELNALDLGNISWAQEAPSGTNVTFQTRTGDTAAPDDTWSSWSDPLINPIGSAITSPAGKYLQYKVNLSTSIMGVSPLVYISGASPVQLNYSRAPSGSSELYFIDYVTVSKGGATYAYNKNGLLLWIKGLDGSVIYSDPSGTVNPLSLPDLVFNTDGIDKIMGKIPGFLLNDTQKEIYLKDAIIISELTSIKSVDGTITDYCQGQISKITRPDGTIITDVVFDEDNNAEDFSYYKDGETYIVKNGKIDTVITSAGEHIKYYQYGMKRSVETDSGQRYYDYGAHADSVHSANLALQDGSFGNTSFYNDNDATFLTLSQASLQFGTGVDGIKHVTENETLASGEYNFTSLFIDAGKTLTVAQGAVIKVLDNVIVNGTLSGSGITVRAYSFTVNAGGAVIGVGQHINAHDINNAGTLMTDAIRESTTIHSSAGSSISSNLLYAYDGNLDTGFGYSMSKGGSGDWGYSVSCYSVNTFPSPVDLQQISYKLYTTNNANGNYPNGCAYQQIDVQYAGSSSWTNLWTYNYGRNTGARVNQATQNGNWNNVIAIRAIAGAVSGGDRDGNCGAYIYEIQAYTNPVCEYACSTGSVPGSATQISFPSSGNFISKVIELNALDLGNISWAQEAPSGTNVTFQTRTGDTAAPDDTWSSWSDPLTSPIGSAITSPAGKYLQYKVNLSTTDVQTTPKVVLDARHNIVIGYTKFSENPIDPYVKIKEGSNTCAYNKDGSLIWTEDITGNRTFYDPADSSGSIEIGPLKFDSSYTDILKQGLPSYKLSDAQKVLTIYDKGNDLPVEIVTAGQSITYFDRGFATKVVDKNGVTLVVYTYDANENVIKVEFVDARRKLGENYQKAVAEIVTQKESALAKIAKAETDARADITSKSADIQKQIDDERARIEQEKAKYDPNIYDLSEFDRVFREIDDYEAKLHRQTQDAFLDLDSQLVSARARILADASTAMQDLINNDYNKILADIVQKESSPLIYQYYRKVLGRDPGDADLLYWTNVAKAELRPLTACEITQYIKNLQEYADRQLRKDNIVNGLKAFFAQYISCSDAERQNKLTELGLSASEAVSLTQEEIDKIISWLSGQSLHFGDSAFETIISLLKNSGINKSFEEIGGDAIKIDILTGVITPENSGDLLISMYAMRKAAQVNGLTLYSKKISYDALKDAVSGDNIIVHIDGNHYVLVTKINETDGTITYIDPTVGVAGQDMTISRAEFMEKWKGYALSKELPADPAKQLNVTQEKNIRGSGWWEDFWRGICEFFQKIVAPVATILLMIPPVAFVGAILAGINIIIQTVSFVVHTGTLMDVVWSVVNTVGSAIGASILSGIYGAAGKVFSSIGQAIFAPLKGIFSAVMPIFNNLSAAVSSIATGIGQIVSLGFAGTAKIAEAIGYSVISQGISLGTNYLFQSMHLDPTWSNIGSAILTGAIMGAVTTNTNIVAEALKYGTIAGVEEIGKAADLDPNITHLSAMMAGSLIGGALDIDGRHLSYDDLMDSISPMVVSECAYIGINKAGELLGVDPRISYLAGIGIRSSLNMGFGRDLITGEWKLNPANMWQGVQNGLLSGITNVALEWAYQSLDLSPLLGSLAASTVGATLEALFNHQDPLVNIGKRSGEYIMDLGTFGMYDPQTGQLKIDPWSQAVYISKVLDFARIIREADDPAQGLVTALETYSSAIFHQQAIESIVKEGGILAMVTGRAEIIVDPETGKEKKRLWTSYEKKYYADIDMQTGNLTEKFEPIDGVDVLIKQRYSMGTDGEPKVDGRTVIETCKDGFTRTTNYDAKGNLINIISAKDGSEYELAQYNGALDLDADGNPRRGVLIDKQTGQKTYFDGYNVKIENPYEGLGINIGADSLLSPLYFNPTLDTGETATRVDKINNMESDVTNTSSNLYSSAFTDMISRAHQYASSDGSLDLSTFGDYTYWSSFGDLASYYDNWSADINNLFRPVSIDETSTYEDIINSVEDSGKIDELKTKTQEMNIFFEFANQMALKARGVITEVSPAMFSLVKGLSIWTTDAYAFDGIMNNSKSDSMSFLDKAYDFISSAGNIISSKADILKEAFWNSLKNGVNNVSPYFSTLSTFANSVYDLAQGGAEINIDKLKSLGTSMWQNIKTTAGEMKDLATYFKYMGSLALTNPDLPFAQGALLSLIGGDTNAWSNLQDAADSAFNIANNLYDISSAFIDNSIDYASDVKKDIVNSTWWNTLKYSIIYNVDSVKDGFGYVTDKAIDLLTTSKDVFLNKVEVASQAAIYGQQKLMESFVELGKDMGLQAYEFWTNPNTISAIKNTSSNILNEIIGTIDDVDSMQKTIEFFGLVDPAPRIETSSIILKTAYVDQKLNWLPFYNNVPATALDLITGVRFGNMRWDAANKSAAPYYENYVLQGMRGISLSGINDDGVTLDRLTQMITPYVSGSFTITHSAGIGVLLNSSITTDKVIILSPQAPRADLEAWIDRMGLTPDKVIVVDVAGDLPFRPVDLVDLSPTEIAQNFTNPAQLLATDATNLINNNGYHDYSQNPNGKYTYVRIESGHGIGLNPVDNHGIGINGALDTDKNGNYYKYGVSINGVSQGYVFLQDVYKSLLSN